MTESPQETASREREIKRLEKRIEELESRLSGVESALSRVVKVTDSQQRIGGDKGYFKRR